VALRSFNFQNPRFRVLALDAEGDFLVAVPGGDRMPAPAVGCATAVDNYFEDEAWAKVGVRKCPTCHQEAGDAEGSEFVLIDARKRGGADHDEALRQHRALLARIGAVKEKDKSSRFSVVPPDRRENGPSRCVNPSSARWGASARAWHTNPRARR
jgi:hypothetical protein